jgi:serine protease Do
MRRNSTIAVLAAALLFAYGCRAEEAPQMPAAGGGPGTPEGGFRNVVQEVLPAIVFIQTEIAPPPGLQRLFPGARIPDEPIPMGMGSGVIFTDDGYILTNNHVVLNADRVRVVLEDRRHYEAEVVGRDPSTDVAVVRIPGNGFPAARLGDSDRVEPGDWVLALGSPLGLQFSVTAGVVSGIGRSIGILHDQREAASMAAAPLEHFIQTDAALSPGNSGGPLVNLAGEVVGINTAVAAGPGVPGNVGFAIPSNLARQVAEQLINLGEVRRAYVGAFLENVTPTLAAAEGLERVQGAVITYLESGGPLHQAGFQPGDVIVEVAGQPIRTVSDLQNQLLRLEPGSTVVVQAFRAGRPIERPVSLGMVRGGGV